MSSVNDINKNNTVTGEVDFSSQRATTSSDIDFDKIGECRDVLCPNKQQAESFISLKWKYKELKELYDIEINKNSSEIILQIPNKNLIDYYIIKIMKSINFFMLYVVFFLYVLNTILKLNIAFYYIMLASAILVLLEYFTIKLILTKLNEKRKLLNILQWFNKLNKKEDEDANN